MSRRIGGGLFLRLVRRALLARPGQITSALLALVVTSAVATAMLALYADVQAKLRQEFRSYGANIAVVSRTGAALPPDALDTCDRVLGGRGIAVPFAYAIARANSDIPVVVAGTDLGRVRRLNPWWSVSRWPTSGHEALLGARAAPVIASHEAPFQLTYSGRSTTLQPAGVLRTGADEDSRVYMDLAQFEAWTRVQPSSVEIRAEGEAVNIRATLEALQAELPGAEVRPVRQVVDTEVRVLAKTRAMLVAAIAIIIVTSLLCVWATLTAWVLERRREFAVMKALGGSERIVSAFFAAEATALGAAGAIMGFVIGLGAAAWIARANFGTNLAPRWGVLPIVFAGSVVLALVSAVLPARLLRRMQPAAILRGE